MDPQAFQDLQDRRVDQDSMDCPATPDRRVNQVAYQGLEPRETQDSLGNLDNEETVAETVSLEVPDRRQTLDYQASVIQDSLDLKDPLDWTEDQEDQAWMDSRVTMDLLALLDCLE